MSTVYSTINSQLDSDSSYSKADIMTTVRQIIVQTTVDLTAKQQEADVEEEPITIPAAAPVGTLTQLSLIYCQTLTHTKQSLPSLPRNPKPNLSQL